MVFEADILRADLALLCLAATVDQVGIVVSVLEHLFTVETLLRPHLATILMPLQLLFAEVSLAILAGYLGVRFLVMLLLVSFGYNFATSSALVVAPGAPDLMNAKLCNVYFFLAGAAPLRSYWSFW